MYVIVVAAALVGAAAVLPGLEPRPGIPGEDLSFSHAGDAAGVCGAGQFLCRDGSRCVPAAWRCDAHDHCPDGSDELHCDHLRLGSAVNGSEMQCGAGQFRCAASGRCVPHAWRCDGDNDCGPRDDSDEDPFQCQKEFKCPNNTARCSSPLGGVFECTPVRSFCDGMRDCRDGSDEWDICDNFTMSQCAPLKCAEGCRPTFEGLTCFCSDGYQPTNGKCEDLDECQEEAACAQRCRNTPGSYSCACVAGYKLQPDGHSCRANNDPTDDPASLLVITQEGISRVWPAGVPQGKANQTLPTLQASAMDFHYSNKSFCYIHHNFSRSGVVCASVDDMSKRWQLKLPTLFPSVDSITFMALDWVSGAWYLVDGGAGAMFVCAPRLQHCRMLQDSLVKLHGLALDPTPPAAGEPAGFMFWSVWGASPARVLRSELWGGEPVDLVSERLVYPTAITLDLTNKWIYWVDAYMDSVERSDYNGGKRVTVFRGYESEKVSLISNFEDSLYLPLWANQSVLSTSRYARTHARSHVSAHTQKTIPVPARITAVLMYHRQRQPVVSHPCAVNNGGCGHICITAWRGATPVAHCLCRHGFHPSAHPHGPSTACQRVELDSYLLVSRGSPPLVQALSPTDGQLEAAAPAAAARPTVADVHLATGQIYLSDVHRYEIVRQNLDGTGREVFMEDVDNCEGLAIDWMGENLYWTDDALGQIAVARLSAPEQRRVLIREPQYHPRSIALDPQNGVMYWSVWATSSTPTGSIETAQMDGSARRTLVTGLHWPNGLVLQTEARLLYWCDTFMNKIESLDLSTNKRTTILAAPHVNIQKPYGLALIDGDVVWSEHGTGAIRRVSVDGGVTLLRKVPPPLYDVRLVAGLQRLGRNACSTKNGGCAELCLATASGRVCACADGRAPPPGQPLACARAASPPPPCGTGRFHCGRGRCIDISFVCDGDFDCPDSSDEDDSPTGPCANMTCSDKTFKCDVNRCIPKSWVCDGQKDCQDGADESSAACAQVTCSADQFLCTESKRCVPAAWRCDGAPDCGPGDRSDEQKCNATESAECHPLVFRCPNGGCVPWEYYCDGRADCSDGGDEASCHAAPPRLPNREDTNKNSVCEEHEFQCANRECIRMEFRCDYRADCLDSSDEANCESHRSTTPPPPAAPAPAECGAPALRCDNGTRCVPLLQLCDGSADCADAADEADRCGEPMCEAAACTHDCHPTPSGAVCACPASLHLQRDGVTCADAHVCTEWGVCSQTCKPQKNRHKCTCYEGYQLADDGFTCKSTEHANPLLVFSNRHEVRAVELPSLTSRALISSLKNTVALDWKRTGDLVTLYWTDVVDDHIYSGTVQGIALSDIKVVIDQGVSTAEGLAVDWVANNLYWVEGSLHQIEVARLDGRYRRTLVSGDMESPRAIAVDPKHGYLFWSDWEQAAPRIERCSMGGNGRTVVVRVDELANGAWPNGITLDHLATRLYWIDAKSDSIHTTLYDGTGYQLVLRGHAMLSHPFAVTLFESHVYWTDWRSNSVVRANKWNGSDVAVVQRTMMQPFDIKVIHPSRQPALSVNPCAVDNGNCSHLCLLDGPNVRVCACPHVMRLASDNVTCEVHEKVIVVGRTGSIRGLDLDAPAQPAIPAVWGAQLAAPRTLATLTSQRLLYWSEAEVNEIKRTNLTGGTAENVVEMGAGTGPGGAMALDWASGVLYYYARGAVWASGLAGERAVPLMDASNVSALAVDVQRGRLYFAVTTEGDGIGVRIESAAGDCTGRRKILDAARDPLLAGVASLTVEPVSGWLYWVNLASASIQFLDVKTGEFFTVELATGARPLALDIHFERLLWADGDGLKACPLPRNHTQAVSVCEHSELLRANTEGVLSLRVYDAATQNGTRGACARRGAADACAHLCLPVSDKDSVCACAAGYVVNGTKCTPEDEILVYSMSGEIRALALNAPAHPVLPPVAQPALCTALDYRADGDWIYWADSESGVVARARRDGTGRAALVSQPEPLDAQPVDWLSGLAVDWVAGNMYWADPRRALVEVARADGSHRYVLLDTDPLAVTTLVVDSVRGWLFLSGGGWIQRARLDGSQRDLLYNGTAVADVAIDSENEMIYWADTWDPSIWRMRYDGRAQAAVARHSALRHPAALAVHGHALYWIDTMLNRGSILSAPLTNLSDYKILLDNAGDSLKDLFIWSRAAQTPPPASAGLARNPCGAANGGCEALCLWDGGRARCVCPHGDLAADGHSCAPYKSFLMYSRVTKIDSIHLEDEKDLNSPYPPIQNEIMIRIAISLAYWYEESRLFYSDIQRGAIGSVHFDGSDHKTLLSQLGAVEGMVFESRTKTLYWTCNSASIRRAHVPSLDAHAHNASRLVQTVIQLAPGDRPRGIDVDPCESRLYWTNWNDTNPRIQRAYSSGRELQTIISKDILMPNGLAIEHTTRMLFWADARLDKIERCLLDGSHRHVVVRAGAEHPFDVAACAGWVFWSDWVGRGVLRADGRGGGARALRKDLPRPMGLVCVTPNHQTCSSDPCATLNGGCAEICTKSSGGVVCSCAAGRELNPDRSSCRPVNTHCPDGHFACAEGECIPEDLVCDGISNCGPGDASDEDLYYCTSRSCPADTVSCGAGGRCVRAGALCDGVYDCDDGSDETVCDCPDMQYRCGDGACVPLAARCSGLAECADGSDEAGCARAGCAELGAAALPCGAGAGCYLPQWRCDGAPDCPDGADEAGCGPEHLDTTTPLTLCSEDQFTCSTEGIECIPLTWRCDGRVDCSDGSDETLHCGHRNTTVCKPDEFSCGSVCVSSMARCDGAADCPFAEDEADCACAPRAFRCAAERTCLHEGLYCDGDADCSDGSDEPPGCAPAAPTSSSAPPTPASNPCAEPGALYCGGRCLPPELVCDGRDHCLDGLGEGAGSDEDPFMCSSYSRATAHDAALGVAQTSRSACAAGEWQCANRACVPRAALCDSRDDCGDYSDERRCNINECLIRNGGCQHNCTELAVGHACWCRAGWRRAPTGCADVDECAEDAPCDHRCRNTIGSFVCSCESGYRLMQDGVSCAPISNEPASLIFTNRYYVRRVTLDDAHASSLLIHNLTNAVALDMEWERRCLYWSDVTRLGSSIKRACREPGQELSHYQILHGATLQNPDGLAVDWVAGNVYWCDKGTDTLEVSRTDGTHRRVLIRTGLQEPRGLALHPARGTIYWSDWGTSPHIGRAGMDGSARTILISAGLGWPNALVVSHASQELYFADAREDYIAVADLDGKHVRVLFSRDRMPWLRLHHVFALTVWEGRVYWSDWETRAVESCRRRPNPHYKANATEDISAGGAYECKTVALTVHKPMDLRVHHPARQPPAPELTALCVHLNCSGLCLLTPATESEPAGARCECPEHFVLAADGRSCRPNCTSAHFVCASTLKCIPFWWRCDTQDDCGDGSDEPASCPSFRCSPGQFQCGGGGRCLHPALICDATRHCADGSDERDCDTFTCLSSQLKCAGNATAGVAARCVPAAARCDGARDCPAGDDERDCPPRSCKPDHFMCGDGSCVPDVWVCDADADCADGADEGAHCAARACPPRHFRCASGRCIPREWLCDSEADCPLQEDEASCGTGARAACEATYFRCADGRCIPGRWRCDFEDDCGDLSDEQNCTPRNCSETEFRCANGECIRGLLRCSGGAECADGSDEVGCAPACAARARPCRTPPQCVLREWWCDGSVDCADGSDEESCAAAPAPACGARLACAGAECAPAAWRCDGRRDCAAGQDEARCARRACAPPMLRCGNNTCVPPGLLCDGFRDCDDGSDENEHACSRRSSESLCEQDEEMCGDGRCVPAGAACDTGEEGPCPWHLCSQLCIPKHAHNHTCKCIEGYKHRQLPDNTWTCEAVGEKPQVIVAINGSLRAWELTKRERDARALYEPKEGDSAEITSVAVGWVNSTWMVWWADSEGGLRALDATSALRPDAGVGLTPPPAKLLIQDPGIIRGVAFDWVSQRLYFTSVTRGGAGDGPGGSYGHESVGAVAVCAPDGRRRVTLARRPGSEPDDILVHNNTRQIFWSDRGANPGIMVSGMDGANARWLVRRRVRRVTALALSTDRLYFVDAYYDVLESVRLDGSARVVLATFSRRPYKAPSVPHLVATDAAANSSYTPYSVSSSSCARLAAWEDWLWCAGRRGLARLPRRRPAPPLAPRALRPVSALAVVHAVLFPAVADPCASGPCHASALCVRSAAAAFSCLCPDGLTTTNLTALPSERECILTPAGTPAPAACPLDCGPGTCRLAGGVPACACGALYAGERCQHYRCGQHCHYRGRCVVAGDDLKCVCFAGYTGERCELEASNTACATWRCDNGGTCHSARGLPRCTCASGYTGIHCSQCEGDAYGLCGPGSVCVLTPAGATCRPDVCQGLCLNQGTCQVSAQGSVSCACPPQFTGDRCQRPACVDADCATHSHDTHDTSDTRVVDENDVAGRFSDNDGRLGGDDHDYKPHKRPLSGVCVRGGCLHGGRCVGTSAGARCACAGPYGGPLCAHYVGHGHACVTAACRPPAVCVWRPTDDSNSEGTAYCACLEGASCTPPRDEAVARGGGGAAGAWAGAGAALLILLCVAAVLYLLRRRRQGAFVHARLSDNVEISNPMYLADDEPPRRDLLPPQRENGANHFANPVYESMYAPAANPAEEQNLLAEASDSSPAERAALL